MREKERERREENERREKEGGSLRFVARGYGVASRDARLRCHVSGRVVVPGNLGLGRTGVEL